MFIWQHTEQEAATEPSFAIAHKIAQSNKPFLMENLLKNVMNEASGITCPYEKHKFENVFILANFNMMN